jgi:hypothetical protein
MGDSAEKRTREKIVRDREMIDTVAMVVHAKTSDWVFSFSMTASVRNSPLSARWKGNDGDQSLNDLTSLNISDPRDDVLKLPEDESMDADAINCRNDLKTVN